MAAEATIIKTGINCLYKESPAERGFLLQQFYSLKKKRMERFTKEIEVGNETRLFVFTQLRNTNGVKFFITSKDSNNKPISFSLKEKESNNWKLVPGSLRWLYDIEQELSDAIVDTRQV